MGTQKQDWRGLRDEEWARIAPLIPPPKRQGKRRKFSDRQLVDALLYRKYTGAKWSELPGLEDIYLAMVKRYTRWRDSGTLDQIWSQLEDMGLLPEEVPPLQPARPQQLPRPLEWWELTDGEWEVIAPLLPKESEKKGIRYKTNRQILNALLYREYTNTPWRSMPQEFGHWRTLNERYNIWKAQGYLDRVFEEMKNLGILAPEKYLRGRPGEGERPRGSEWWEVTDREWEEIAPLLGWDDTGKRGKKFRSDRQMLNGVLCKFRTGVVWAQLPDKYGTWRTVMERYRRWRDDGTLYQIFRVLGLEELPPGAIKSTRPTPQWWEVTDEEWETIAPLLPPGPRGSGRTDRSILNALLYREYTSTPWRELPRELGALRTVYSRYALWRDAGVWEQILHLVNKDKKN